MRNILLIAFFVAIAGCVSSPKISKAIVKWELLPQYPIAAVADTTAIFNLVFQNKDVDWFDKRNLENDVEHRQRLAKAGEGLIGREVSFFIPQDVCRVKADPDALTYTIKVGGIHTSQIPVKSYSMSGGSTNMQNALGAQIRVQTIKDFEQILDIGDIEKFPPEVVVDYLIGITVRFAQSNKDSDTIFRQWIAEKRVGLVIRGKIGDISKARKTRYETTPTFSSPRISINESEYLPFDIEEVSVVVSPDKSKVSNGYYRITGFAKPL